jgi:hypothetical protein
MPTDVILCNGHLAETNQDHDIMQRIHTFHIPVMGTGYSADTPIRVAHFGISSVISLVDDYLLEKLRRHYAGLYRFPYDPIPGHVEDGRARRITAYLNLVADAVRQNMERVKALPFFEENDKKKYFDLLPSDGELRRDYEQLLKMAPGPERDQVAAGLTAKMQPGSIDVNIMVKLDRLPADKEGKPLSEEFSDAKAALRGYANSILESGIVLSAGINQSLYSYMAKFQDFYRDASGHIKKRIILKVSDLRSATIQEKFLAKKGLEISEFRIESGLNCGGHAFETEGRLLPALLVEFRQKRDQFGRQVRPMVKSFSEKMGWTYPEEVVEKSNIEMTVQGGIGTSGEDLRMRKDFGANGTGWGSPFLLVPEATSTDAATRKMLADAKPADLYLSESSPLGVLFNNVRRCSSSLWMQARAAVGKPGSHCAKGFARVMPEYGEVMCMASAEYQKRKLAELDKLPEAEAAPMRLLLAQKECICHQLGNSSLIRLKIAGSSPMPVAICPGPNIAWFSRDYTLQEMVDHIYGRGPSLVPPERPHMFAQEIVLNAELLVRRIDRCQSPKEAERLRDYQRNLEEGMDLCLKIADGPAYPDENLSSIRSCINEQRNRLRPYYERLSRWWNANS